MPFSDAIPKIEMVFYFKMIPIGASIEGEGGVAFESINANRVLGKMQEAGNRFDVVFPCACRNNPFARRFRSLSNIEKLKLAATPSAIFAKTA